MSFFADNYQAIRFPIETEEVPGLRRAQTGAIHAVASHFTIRNESAIVSMPTGSGKTAVLMLTAFVRRASRVLVLTPSRLVRNQIAEEFQSLDTLRRIGAYLHDAPSPNVVEVTKQIVDDDGWQQLTCADIVVATPNSISPAIEGIPDPPNDLFDLVLVDEAHHSPAKTWNELLEAFPDAEKALFTATPFRRDRQEIRGRFVYAFPLKDAFRDGIFGRIQFMLVNPEGEATHDVAIANRAEQVLQADREAGLNHLLMVRTDRKSRAQELKDIYQEHTGLRLRVIHSGHSYGYIKQSIKQLREHRLDGIICVDMLGEGFDLPNLKIAAIHAPHRSLEITLQFIGRFARTADETIGEAKFIAVPSEIEIETTRMYEEGAVWQEIVADLSESRVAEEQNTRETLASFEEPTVTDFTTDDLSLYSLRPFSHVKIYHMAGPIDIHFPINLPRPLEVIFQQVSGEHSAAVLIARERQKPRWTELRQFYDVQHELFVIYFDEPSGLLFINASRKTESLYDEIAKQYTDQAFDALPLSKVDRVLRNLDDPHFFNIGMKNRILSSHAESYRIISGTKADVAVTEIDGNLYDRGHVFGKGGTDNGSVTIGYSSLSKVWSNKSLQIPQSIDWCKEIAAKIVDEAPVQTRSGLDYLAVGEEVDELPAHIISADWDEETYKHPPQVMYRKFDGVNVQADLLDLEVKVDIEETTDATVRVTIVGLGMSYEVDFSLHPRPQFVVVPPDHHEPIVNSNQQISLVEYLNNRILHFYCADLSRLHGKQFFPTRCANLDPFDRNRIEAIDWAGNNVDIQREFGAGEDGRVSIHDYLKSALDREEFDVVVYDHRTGEIADIITLSESATDVIVRLYHCKGSGGATPGNRIGDVYEVCGQVVKSLKWMANKAHLIETIRRRVDGGSEFIRGDMVHVAHLLRQDGDKPVRFQVALVQPGISKGNLSNEGGFVLAAAADYFRRTKSEELIVLASD